MVSPGPLMMLVTSLLVLVSPWILDIVSAPALLCRGLKSVAITPVLVIWILIHPPLTFLTVPGYFSRNLRQYLSYLWPSCDKLLINKNSTMANQLFSSVKVGFAVEQPTTTWMISVKTTINSKTWHMTHENVCSLFQIDPNHTHPPSYHIPPSSCPDSTELRLRRTFSRAGTGGRWGWGTQTTRPDSTLLDILKLSQQFLYVSVSIMDLVILCMQRFLSLRPYTGAMTRYTDKIKGQWPNCQAQVQVHSRPITGRLKFIPFIQRKKDLVRLCLLFSLC